MSPPHNMVNFGPLAAEIDPVVWGTPANFNGFCVLAALLHGSQVLGMSQTLQHWTEGATYIRQAGHHVGHWPTFLVVFNSSCFTFAYIVTLKNNSHSLNGNKQYNCALKFSFLWTTFVGSVCRVKCCVILLAWLAHFVVGFYLSFV